MNAKGHRMLGYELETTAAPNPLIRIYARKKSLRAGMPGKIGREPSTAHRPTLDRLLQTGIVIVEADRGRGLWKGR